MSQPLFQNSAPTTPLINKATYNPTSDYTDGLMLNKVSYSSVPINKQTTKTSPKARASSLEVVEVGANLETSS